MTPSWRTLFYPEDLPKRKWFEFYCLYFNTYEFNSSFYRFPTTENLLQWYEKVPEDFEFSIKVPRIITHIKKMENCETDVAKFYQVCKEGLKDKLGCILWQFPPSYDFSGKKLESIIRITSPDFKNVIEFRHESWWRAEVENDLSHNNLIFCNVNYPKLPTTIVQTMLTGYVRMHGNPQLFHSQYTKQEIESLYKKLIIQPFEEVYVYFNNTASTAGIINALQLKEIHLD